MGAVAVTSQALAGTVLSASTQVTLPSGASTTGQIADLSAVSCPTTNSCVAIGYYQDSAGREAMVLPITDGVPGTAQQVSLPAGALSSGQYAELNSLSCPASDLCIAVGRYRDSNGDEAMVVPITTSVPGTAREVTLPSDAVTGYQYAVLTSVSCVSTISCIAVGTYVDTVPNNRGLAVSISNGVPGAVQVLQLPSGAISTGQDASLNLVNCPSSNSCIAVGTYLDGPSSNQALVAPITNGTLGAASQIALPPDAATSNQSANLVAVNCVSSGSCVAVGGYVVPSVRNHVVYHDQHALVVPITNGVSGTASEVALPSDAATYNQVAALQAVSCMSASSCVAVGSYEDKTRNGVAVVVPITNGTPTTVHKVALPSGAKPTTRSAVLNLMSCTSASSCVAVGWYTNSSANYIPVAAPITNGSPGTAQKISLPSGAATRTGSQIGVLDSVSCPSAGACVAAGSYEDPSGQSLAMVAAVTLRPQIVIPRGALTLRGHRVTVPLLCRNVLCRGTVKLKLRHAVNGRTKTTTLGRASFAISPGPRKNLRMRVNTAGLRAIRNAPGHRLRVIESAIVKQGPNLARRKTLRYAKH